jgi:hypothetical protein
VFDLDADAMLHDVSERRVDFALEHSNLGPGGARWELFADGPHATLVALTVWTDPSRATWVIRHLADSAGYGASGANVTVEGILALAVKRRSEILEGANMPVRPPAASSPPSTLVAPTPGPWLTLADRVNLVILTLADDGSLSQVTAVGATTASATALAQRFLAPESYGAFWGWMRDTRVIAREPASVRFSLALDAPLAASHGEVSVRAEPTGDTVWMNGTAGDFAGETHRWDFLARGRLTYVMYTGAAETRHLPLLTRALMDRDAWTVVGVSAWWDVVMLRFGLSGIV